MDLTKVVSGNGFEVVDQIFDYGVVQADIELSLEEKKVLADLYIDYQMNLVFAGKTGKNFDPINDDVAVLLENNPNGFGFRIQSKKCLDFKGRFCDAIVKSQLSPLSKLIREFVVTKENIAEFDQLKANQQVLIGYSEAIHKHCSFDGNMLRDELKQHKRNIAISGTEKGLVKIQVSRFKIDEDNTGELLLMSENSSIGSVFTAVGEIRGLQGVISNAKDGRFYAFCQEGKDLFIHEYYFSKGKEKYVEFGKLVK